VALDALDGAVEQIDGRPQKVVEVGFEASSRDQRSYLAWSTLWMGRARTLCRPQLGRYRN
jgi:hypothetical protein